ncbi:MAG: DHH family phosphoesterase [Candidatus Cloacimonetes bacterium]|nr:DHH family phosphoesterase [Candidatus Cloacimonadota bacterium]
MLLTKPEQLHTTITALCRQPGKIAILTHTNPDGDGLAAALAFKHILRHLGNSSDIILEEEPPQYLDFLQTSAQVLLYKEDMVYPTVFLLDCHEKERTGKIAPLLEHASSVLAIDHHQQQVLEKNWYYYIKPEFVSAGAIIFQAFQRDLQRLPAPEKKYIADCLYTTILNDTDGFINSNTDTSVFQTCAQLCALGTIPAQIMEMFILNESPHKLRFTGQALSSIELSSAGRVMFMHSTQAQLAENDLDASTTSKVTKWVKGATGVQVVIYAREQENDSYRLSLRSSVVDCNAICKTFGGGGHRNAAGCTIPGTLTEVRKIILTQVENQLDE